MPMTMSKIMGCASATNARPKDDVYATPSWCTKALARVESGNWSSTIWEPACGNGDISTVLCESGFTVIGTDINDWSEEHRIDFLKTTKPLAGSIITNPPFKFASEFIVHAYKLGLGYHAWLLKSDFLCAQRAIRLINAVGYPARIWALTERPDFLGQGAPTMCCSWFVWQGRSERAALELLSP
jgi:hypothetical protein